MLENPESVGCSRVLNYQLGVLIFQVNWNEKLFGVFPRVSFNDKGSYVESETKVYDEVCTTLFSNCFRWLLNIYRGHYFHCYLDTAYIAFFIMSIKDGTLSS